MSTKYAPGKRIRFPWTGNIYMITAVDEAKQTVTFAVPFDLDDKQTETFAAMDSVDVEVES